MEVDLRDATTLVNSTFEDMGSAHNDLVKGLEKDAKATNDRMDRIREDTNNDRPSSPEEGTSDGNPYG